MSKKILERLDAIDQAIRNFEAFEISERLAKIEGKVESDIFEDLRRCRWAMDVNSRLMKLESPDKPGCICWNIEQFNGCPVHGPKFTPGKPECICPSKYPERHWINKKCPVCNPAPPLRVRVAKTIGKPWRFPYEPEPYDTDRDLAIGALEEYCHAKDLRTTIKFCNTISGRNIWRVNLYRHASCEYGKAESPNLPTAICEAIIKHSEGAK